MLRVIRETSVLQVLLTFYYILITYFYNVTDIDECISQPCVNGATCDDMVNMYECICAVGWTGEECQTGIIC